ncbi:MAG: hypothetical protein V3U89_03190 [Methylophilaceae bacterium]
MDVQVAFAADEALGRLFSTPIQRSNLDILREAKKNQPTPTETVVQETIIERKPVMLPAAINVQGYVKRNDGKKGTVWVNGKALQEQSSNKDVQVGRLPKNSNRVPIRIPANGKRLTLKAGQTYDLATNKTREARTAVQSDAGRIGDDVLE